MTYRSFSKSRSHWITIGIAIGTGMEVTFNNIPVDITLGLVIGLVIGWDR